MLNLLMCKNRQDIFTAKDVEGQPFQTSMVDPPRSHRKKRNVEDKQTDFLNSHWAQKGRETQAIYLRGNKWLKAQYSGMREMHSAGSD